VFCGGQFALARKHTLALAARYPTRLDKLECAVAADHPTNSIPGLEGVLEAFAYLAATAAAGSHQIRVQIPFCALRGGVIWLLVRSRRHDCWARPSTSLTPVHSLRCPGWNFGSLAYALEASVIAS
jgi:hypothetical protein